jgi:hypothetical protein
MWMRQVSIIAGMVVFVVVNVTVGMFFHGYRYHLDWTAKMITVTHCWFRIGGRSRTYSFDRIRSIRYRDGHGPEMCDSLVVEFDDRRKYTVRLGGAFRFHELLLRAKATGEADATVAS